MITRRKRKRRDTEEERSSFDAPPMKPARTDFRSHRAVVAVGNIMPLAWLLRGAEASYRLTRLIGRGSYGEVFRAERDDDDRPSPDLLAVKCIDKSEHDRDVLLRFASECRILRGLDHPNILRYVEEIETVDFCFLVTEFARDGDLLEYINNRGCLNETEARLIMRQLIEALRYAHTSGVCHRDIKCENILMCHGSDLVKVADWGFATSWTHGMVLRDMFGSLHYAAPELVAARSYLGPEVDCWSLGVVLYAMVAGTLPFRAPNQTTAVATPASPLCDQNNPCAMEIVREKILLCEFQLPSYLSAACQDLIRGLLCLDQNKRLQILDIAAHPWVRDAQIVSPSLKKVIQSPPIAIDQRPEALQNRNRRHSMQPPRGSPPAVGIHRTAATLRPRPIMVPIEEEDDDDGGSTSSSSDNKDAAKAEPDSSISPHSLGSDSTNSNASSRGETPLEGPSPRSPKPLKPSPRVVVEGTTMEAATVAAPDATKEKSTGPRKMIKTLRRALGGVTFDGNGKPANQK